MIQFLKDRMSSIFSDLYKEILKPNKSHTNHIIQIVPCKGGLTRNDLYDSQSDLKSKELLHGTLCMMRFDDSEINLLI